MWVRAFVSTFHTPKCSICHSIWAKSDEKCLQHALPTYFSTFPNLRFGDHKLYPTQTKICEGLTMSSAARPIARETPSPGGCASRWHGNLQPPAGPPELQVDSRRWQQLQFRRVPVARGADTLRSLLPPVRSRCILSFTSPMNPHSPSRPVLERKRHAHVDRCLGRIARAASSWVIQVARCFGCRT